jgi:hypothetical protein
MKPPLVPSKNCSLRVVREWSRVDCTANFLGIWTSIGLGEANKDYFTVVRGLDAGALEVRARRGEMIGVRLNGLVNTSNGVLRVSWPSSQPRPLEIVLDAAPQASLRPPISVEATGTVPPVPEEASAQPKSADWLDGVSVNTASPDQRAAGCEVRVLRDWLQARCKRPNVIAFTFPPTGFGARGTDFFTRSDLEESELVLRLRKGLEGSARFDLSTGSALLRIAWPVSDSKPSVIAFERGPQ